MIESKDTPTTECPRSGLIENSPALQCWVNGELVEHKPVKRAAENGRCFLSRQLQPSATRTVERIGYRLPSDKSLGYFQSSALGTILMFIPVLAFVLAFTQASAIAQTTPVPTPTPAEQT